MVVEKTVYSVYGECIRLANDTVELVATTGRGPRVMRYAFLGGSNILAELGVTGPVESDCGQFYPLGGHRLWHAPEAMPRSYCPDNDPVAVEQIGDSTVRLTQPVEPATGIIKEMTLSLDKSGTRVTVTHKLTNTNMWPVELAPWALTIMNGGGTTIIPQEPFIPHSEMLLPARPLVLWHYSDLSDPRWKFGSKYIRLSTDASLDYAQKIGVANKQGWAGYLREGTLFIKRFPYIKGACYPDYGCNFETFTKGTFMEVESIGQLARVEPGESATHEEQWSLFENVSAGPDDESLDQAIKPLLSVTAHK